MDDVEFIDNIKCLERERTGFTGGERETTGYEAKERHRVMRRDRDSRSRVLGPTTETVWREREA